MAKWQAVNMDMKSIFHNTTPQTDHDLPQSRRQGFDAPNPGRKAPK
jgi:hypothetical protein